MWCIAGAAAAGRAGNRCCTGWCGDTGSVGRETRRLDWGGRAETAGNSVLRLVPDQGLAAA